MQPATLCKAARAALEDEAELRRLRRYIAAGNAHARAWTVRAARVNGAYNTQQPRCNVRRTRCNTQRLWCDAVGPCRAFQLLGDDHVQEAAARNESIVLVVENDVRLPAAQLIERSTTAVAHSC